MIKKTIVAAALSLALLGGTAFAQTTTTATTGTTGTTVGTPNTGAGGNAVENAAILGISAAAVIAGAALLMRRRQPA